MLGALAQRFALVAVVSGRPVSFLAQRLAAAGPAVRLFGAYGLEWIEDGIVHRAPAVEPWRGRSRDVVAAARAAFAGEAVGIEDKEISVTVHWRQAPEAGERAWDFARQWSAGRGSCCSRVGWRSSSGRRSASTRGRWSSAWRAAARRRASPATTPGTWPPSPPSTAWRPSGTRTVRIAVTDEETPPELVAAADVVVRGPGEALDLFRALAIRARS